MNMVMNHIDWNEFDYTEPNGEYTIQISKAKKRRIVYKAKGWNVSVSTYGLLHYHK